MRNRKAPIVYANAEAVDWLRCEMERTRIPQREVAEAMGLDQPAISRILNGTRRMRETEFQKAREFLRVQVSTPASRLRVAAAAARLDSKALARASGISAERVDQLMSEADSNPISDKEAEAVGRVLGMPPRFYQTTGYLPQIKVKQQSRDGMPDSVFPQPHVVSTEGNKISIFAAPMAGDAGKFRIDFTQVERRETPAGLREANGAFGLYVGGDLLLPRYRDGEVVFVWMGAPATVGADAFVLVQPGVAIIGQVRERTNNKVLITSFDGGTENWIDLAGGYPVGKIVGSWCR